MTIYIPWGLIAVVIVFYIFYENNRRNRLKREERRDDLNNRRQELIDQLIKPGNRDNSEEKLGELNKGIAEME